MSVILTVLFLYMVMYIIKRSLYVASSRSELVSIGLNVVDGIGTVWNNYLPVNLLFWMRFRNLRRPIHLSQTDWRSQSGKSISFHVYCTWNIWSSTPSNCLISKTADRRNDSHEVELLFLIISLTILQETHFQCFPPELQIRRKSKMVWMTWWLAVRKIEFKYRSTKFRFTWDLSHKSLLPQCP